VLTEQCGRFLELCATDKVTALTYLRHDVREYIDGAAAADPTAEMRRLAAELMRPAPSAGAPCQREPCICVLNGLFG
jgi:hypothetical protein